jgi:HD-GYP domain-containing protein (c-di-GMP phosphodiesterase class II)
VLSFVGGGAAAWLALRHERQSAERLAAATFETLLNAIDANDEVTGAHVRRVAAYALTLARAAGLDDAAQRQIERVALFHDIGKIAEALFDIVHDDEALTPAERQAIATHPQRGADVLAPLWSFYPELREGVLSHHERWDGSGYPRKLRGTAIPLEARIVAVADTFDAITQNRPYRAGASGHRGAEVIASGRGTQFDPELVDHFLSDPVFATIERIRCETQVVERAGGPRARRAGQRERRQRQPEKSVPSVTFRWRERVAATD